MDRTLHTTPEQLEEVLSDIGDAFIETMTFDSFMLDEMEEVVNKRLLEQCNTFNKENIHAIICVTNLFIVLRMIRPLSNKLIKFCFFLDYDELAVDALVVEGEEERKLRCSGKYGWFTTCLSPIVIRHIVRFLQEKDVCIYTRRLTDEELITIVENFVGNELLEDL